MAAPRVKAHETGPGIFRFLIGDAVLECRRNLHDDERFAASVEFLLALSEDVIQKHRTWWNRAMVSVLLDEEGRPLAELRDTPCSLQGVAVKACAVCQGRGRHVPVVSLAWKQKDIDIPKSSRYRQFAAAVVLLRKTAVLDKKAEEYEEGLGFFNQVLDTKGGPVNDDADDEDADDDEDDP
jgi:hypothetical protein